MKMVLHAVGLGVEYEKMCHCPVQQLGGAIF